jgi:hypothetical protein
MRASRRRMRKRKRREWEEESKKEGNEKGKKKNLKSTRKNMEKKEKILHFKTVCFSASVNTKFQLDPQHYMGSLVGSQMPKLPELCKDSATRGTADISMNTIMDERTNN